MAMCTSGKSSLFVLNSITRQHRLKMKSKIKLIVSLALHNVRCILIKFKLFKINVLLLNLYQYCLKASTLKKSIYV